MRRKWRQPSRIKRFRIDEEEKRAKSIATEEMKVRESESDEAKNTNKKEVKLIVDIPLW